VGWPITLGGQLKWDMGFMKGNLQVRRHGIDTGGTWTDYGVSVAFGHEKKQKETVATVEYVKLGDM
ncbi:hypothetical protein A2U01_0118427, partial [Trifolium medium]|nr:hypothetical protein [Trifolium medium]